MRQEAGESVLRGYTHFRQRPLKCSHSLGDRHYLDLCNDCVVAGKRRGAIWGNSSLVIFAKHVGTAQSVYVA
jgi:hypothetical protein